MEEKKTEPKERNSEKHNATQESHDIHHRSMKSKLTEKVKSEKFKRESNNKDCLNYLLQSDHTNKRISSDKDEKKSDIQEIGCSDAIRREHHCGYCFSPRSA